VARIGNAQDKRTETPTTVLQALYLMNGRFTTAASRPESSPVLAAIAGAGSQVPTTKRIEELFLVTLSRMPTAVEKAKFTAYVDSGGPAKDRTQALADLFWALLNSGEFVLNH
jgi:hypothetical protein